MSPTFEVDHEECDLPSVTFTWSHSGCQTCCSKLLALFGAGKTAMQDIVLHLDSALAMHKAGRTIMEKVEETYKDAGSLHSPFRPSPTHHKPIQLCITAPSFAFSRLAIPLACQVPLSPFWVGLISGALSTVESGKWSLKSQSNRLS